MTPDISKILISSKSEREKKLKLLQKKLFEAAYFSAESIQKKQLAEIIENVRTRGDEALIEFTKKFDGAELKPGEFRITKDQIKKAHEQIDKKLLSSIRKSIENVRKYQQKIFIGKNSAFSEGTGIRYTPIKRIGICVPGASAPLPSTVIMTAIPAKMAGVCEIAVISPPRYKGNIHPVILAVCCEIGIEEVYRIGGAHGVAALAYGTKTIKKVDKIAGPGNSWVQMAKKEVFGMVDIDSIAGPSEVLIIANEKANPAWAAADMLSQAEHAPGSAVVFTNSKNMADEILKELQLQVQNLERSEQTMECLINYSAIVLFDNLDEAIEQANNFASEHLEIQCGDESENIAAKIENAGAMFIGNYTPVAVGDYWAGPSHTLPTGTTAKFFSALTCNDFLKSISIINYSKDQFADCAEDIIRLSETEGLDGHSKSIKIRK